MIVPRCVNRSSWRIFNHQTRSVILCVAELNVLVSRISTDEWGGRRQLYLPSDAGLAEERFVMNQQP